MEWLYNLFLEHSALQAVVVLSLISAIGLGLGRVHFWVLGHFRLSIHPEVPEVTGYALSCSG